LRLSLFYNPRDLLERLAVASQRLRRRRRLLGTPAARLRLGHLDTLELLEMLKPNPPTTIYDIGASVGTWTCLAKSIFPGARVEAFEPLAASAEQFLKDSALWKNDVRLHACALGVADGAADLQVMELPDASSLLSMGEEGVREFKTAAAAPQRVPVHRLDSLIESEALPLPDLMKLDVQGYELEVLRGGEGALRHARAIICEVSFRRFYEGQPLFAEVAAFLEERGLRLSALGTSTPLGAPLVQTDALFIR
jgi:FkbM family methyltransferase